MATDDSRPTGVPRKTLITTLVIATLALSWSQWLELNAAEAGEESFREALGIAALARVLDGAISVAQGTELAVQPVGVGVTLTLGQVLDPLNDLVERFSALALTASVALGIQVAATKLLGNDGASLALSAVAAAYLLALWLDRGGLLRRVFVVAVYLRFAVPLALLTSAWIDNEVLTPMRAQAVMELTATRDALDPTAADADLAAAAVAEPADSMLDSLRSWLQVSPGTTQREQQATNEVDDIAQTVEGSVEAMINLIIVFLLQTLVLPIAALWVTWQALLTFLRQDE